jgi:hypothetical protein
VEGDLDRAVDDRSALANEVIEPRFHQRAVSGFIDVDPVRIAGRLAVDEHAVRDRRSGHRWTHDEVDIAGVEAERERPSARFSTLALLPIVQSPESAHWLSINICGGM